MAEITCGRKNPCRVAFGQQRGVTPGLSFRAPGGSPRNGAIMDPAMICSDYALEGIRESGNIRGRLSLGPGDAENARRLATQLIELQPDANDAATISRFSASGHDRLRFPVPFVPITEFVDTACPHNKNDHIRLRETKRFGKAVLGGGRLNRRTRAAVFASIPPG
jgi:hypothetical protein